MRDTAKAVNKKCKKPFCNQRKKPNLLIGFFSIFYLKNGKKLPFPFKMGIDIINIYSKIKDRVFCPKTFI